MKIPSVTISKEDYESYRQIMLKGNNALRKCADLTGMEYRKFRAKLFKCTDGQMVADWKPEHVATINESLPAINAVRAIEWQLLCGHIRFVHRQVKTWMKRNLGVPRDDYYQEAVMALLDAIYSYSREDIAFMTFVWWAIHNRISTAWNKNRPLSPLTNEALGLLKRFDTAKNEFNRYVTDDEIFEFLKLSEDEIEVLVAARTTVYSPDDLYHPSISDGKEYLEDYTAKRRGIDNENNVTCDYEILEAVEHANLTSFERKIVDTYMMPHYGWQEDLASQHINPNTQSRYTRQAINVMLKKALGKIRKAYKKQKNLVA